MDEIEQKIDADVSAAWEKIDAMADGFYSILPNLVIAVCVFVLFYFIGRVVQHLTKKWTENHQSANVGLVLGRLLRWVVLLMGFMVSVSIVVDDMGPSDLFKGLGIGSVAIGFAFKDILQNFLAGILILLREPFKIGDSVIFGEYEGTIESIETRSTLLRTYDGQRVIIPNGSIFTNSIEVVSAFPHRRKSATIGIGYDDDINRAREKAIEAMKNVEGVLDHPAPMVTVEELAASSVNLKAFWWSKNEDYMEVYTRVFVAIKDAFDMDDIEMPYSKVELVNPHVDVHLKSTSSKGGDGRQEASDLQA